jgi:hypothetical protein
MFEYSGLAASGRSRAARIVWIRGDRQSPKISKSEVTSLVSSWRPTTAATTTRVRHERVPKLNPEDEQAVLLAATAVREKLEGAENNDGDEARRLRSIQIIPSPSLFLVRRYRLLVQRLDTTPAVAQTRLRRLLSTHSN